MSNPIQQLRRDRGLTQQQLAVELGVSVSTVIRWERGDGMRQRYIAALVERYDLDPRELLSPARSERE